MLKPKIGSKSKLLTEGKTKIIYEDPSDPTMVIVRSKDDITAGNGARHDVINGKGALATKIACNIFNLLKKCGIPLAYSEQKDAVTFSAKKCVMIPLEVVARRFVAGSYAKRNPHIAERELLPQLAVEFFLKTSNKQWRETSLPCDDPLLESCDSSLSWWQLYLPSVPLLLQKPFQKVSLSEIFDGVCKYPEDADEHLAKIEEFTRLTFFILEKAFQMLGMGLVDIKLEFGFDSEGKLLLADVIDNDSWRLTDESGNECSKQLYRDGADIGHVKKMYEFVAEATDKFWIGQQQIILWTASEKDATDVFYKAIADNIPSSYSTKCFAVLPHVHKINCSVHKKPELALQEIRKAVFLSSDTVVIAYIGRSNGAGPTLSAAVNVPVISVPATWKEHWGDVDSSLRTASEVPTSTILEPSNAVLHALIILAQRNPFIYGLLQLSLEARL